MTEQNDSDFEAHCATFYSIIDNNTPNNALIAKTLTVGYQPLTNETANPSTYEPSTGANLAALKHEHHWNNLLVNMASISELHLPKEGMYKPK